IEKDFAKGKISAVVTTAALSAGVDFPASQVIFESLLMGNKWLNPNEFSQMLGRAGRPTYHERGIVYLLPEINNDFNGETEDAVAISLLESDVDNINLKFHQSNLAEDILANISSNSINTTKELNDFYKNILLSSNNKEEKSDSEIDNFDINYILDELIHRKLVKVKSNFNNKNNSKNKNKYNSKNKNNLRNSSKIEINLTNGELHTTKYGRAVSASFLDLDEGDFIKKSLKKINSNFINSNSKSNNSSNTKNNKFNNSNSNNNKFNNSNSNNNNNLTNNKKNNTINLNINKKYLKNTSFNPMKDKEMNLISDILKLAIDLDYFDNTYLSGNLHKEIVSKIKVNFSSRLFADSTLDIISSGETISKLDKKYQDALLKIQLDFLQCSCQEKPFCDCLSLGISKFILNKRLNSKDPFEISRSLFRNYQIQAYSGDIFSWLDGVVRYLDAIKRIAEAFNYEKVVEGASILINIIEG
ncbi:MAG: DUF5814 domain-containing protein, partial [Methanobrevibacter sp.]|nr:DUF5814 domain-containing protein [Methanobrevibacter sp.]